MGIDANHSRFLLYAKSQGASFEKTATLGRQGLLATSQQLLTNFLHFGIPTTTQEAEQLLSEGKGYVEPCLCKLGAAEIVSVDASNYEQATYVHDFILPIKNDLKERFTTVLDAGTLEHIFNFPVAIKNCMEMLEAGGHFVGITPTNNFSGHGFYQFSPELFYQIFSARNGFEIVKILLYEDVRGTKWYEVFNPEHVKHRTTFVNTTPSYLGVIARRVRVTEVFSSFPQQSDYAAAWASGQSWASTYESSNAAPAGLMRRVMGKARNYVEAMSFLCRIAMRYRSNYGFGYNPQFFGAVGDLKMDSSPINGTSHALGQGTKQ
jgi:hypothetical protein